MLQQEASYQLLWEEPCWCLNREAHKTQTKTPAEEAQKHHLLPVTIPWGMHRSGQYRASTHKHVKILCHSTFRQRANKQCSKRMKRPAKRGWQRHASGPWQPYVFDDGYFQPNIAVYLKTTKKKKIILRNYISIQLMNSITRIFCFFIRDYDNVQMWGNFGSAVLLVMVIYWQKY